MTPRSSTCINMDDIIQRFAEAFVTFEHGINDLSVVIKQIRSLSPQILLANKEIVSFAILVATLKIKHRFTPPGKFDNRMFYFYYLSLYTADAAILLSNDTEKLGECCKMHSEFCKTQDQWRQICSTHRTRMHRMWKRIAKVNLERSDMSLVQDYTDGGDINCTNGNLLFYTCVCGCDVLS